MYMLQVKIIHEMSCIFELGNFEMYDVGEISNLSSYKKHLKNSRLEWDLNLCPV